jgi:hypothetical protein
MHPATSGRLVIFGLAPPFYDEGGMMAQVQTRWWGVIVSLNREEACFAATGSPVGEALLNSIPVWGQLIWLAVKVHKTWIAANTGTDGIDLHFSWAFVLHYVGRRGDYQSCGIFAIEAQPNAELVSRQ